MQLGKRFKEYRLSCQLTQQEAANKAGISVVTLRQFENGKMYNITMNNFLGLLRAVDCLDHVEELLPEIPVSGKRKSYRAFRRSTQSPKLV